MAWWRRGKGGEKGRGKARSVLGNREIRKNSLWGYRKRDEEAGRKRVNRLQGREKKVCSEG